MSGKIYLDFEYNKSKEFNLNPICVSYHAVWDDEEETGNYWLLDDEEREEFIEVIEEFIDQDFTFIAFYAAAEARALYSLGIEPVGLKWVCLWVEYHMCLNHNHELSTGDHLVDGKKKRIYPPIPKWQRVEGDPTSQKAETSLVACTYKLLGIDINLEEKDAMRDLILSKDEFTEEEQAKIMHYCQSDIKYLPQIMRKIYAFYHRKFRPSDRIALNEEILERGTYAALTAIMEAKGYPIDVEATRNFADSVGQIIFEMQDEIEKKFDFGPFLISKKGDKYTQKAKPIRDWVTAQNHDTWLKTDKGDLSLSLEAFEKHYSSKGDTDNFGNAFVKYLRNKQSLNGFLPKRKGKTIWDNLGSDGRVRPYFGIFRAQSSRSQPSATSYILLKSSWMRCLIKPEPGRAICAIDYSSQEFLIAALLSNDEEMLAAYESGDVYLYTAKLAGAVPWEGTREEYPELREKFKSTVLGIQYLMSPQGLAVKLTNDTGVEHTEEEARELIDLFQNAYPKYQAWREDFWDDYLDRGYYKLPCGWTMFGDNQNRRSACNMPIQGTGASIMRKAVELAYGEGLEVIMTLHDALYIECDTARVSSSLEKLRYAMDAAFRYYFDNPERATCRMDPTVWGPDFEEGETLFFNGKKFKAYNTYIDERTRADYEKYKKYFVKDDDLALL